MDYRDLLDFNRSTVHLSSSESSEENVSPNTSTIEDEIDKLRAIPARNFYNDPEVKQISEKNKLVCMLSENLMKKYGLVNENYYFITTNEQLNSNKTKGFTSSGEEEEFLIKVIEIKSSEKINQLGECAILPDIVFYNLGIAKNSFVILKKSSLYFDDVPLEKSIGKKQYPIKTAKKIVIRPIKSRYSNFITPEIFHNLLRDQKYILLHKSETIILNFSDIIDEEFYSKIPPLMKEKYLKIKKLKKLVSKQHFHFILQVNYIEFEEDEENNKKKKSPSIYSHMCLFDPKKTQISVENPYKNSFLPLKNLPITNKYPAEFLTDLAKVSYFVPKIKQLKNMLKINLASSSYLQTSKPIILLSHPKGFSISFWIQRLASKYGLNYREKKINQCYTVQQIEKAIYKAMAVRPSILLLRGFSHIQTLLAQKAAISKSNSLSAYFSHLSDIINDANSKSPDNLPTLIIFTESAKEKVDDLYAEIPEVFNYLLNFESPSQEDHIEIIKFLFGWFKLTIEDLEGIANASKGLGWKQIHKIIQNNYDSFSPEKLKSVFESQRKEMSTVTALNIPNVNWQDVGGLMEAKDAIIETITLPQYYPELFPSKIKPRTGILFFGPPGTGKTMLAKAVANECKMNFMSVKGPELLNMYVGESEKNVRDIFNRARSNLPCIIFFDELDALVPNRGTGSDSSSVMDRIVAQFMTEIDGLGKEMGLFVIGATNRPDLLDPSLLRPGRFDKMIYLGINEDKESRIKILKAQTRKFNLNTDVDLDKLEEKVPKNFTGADFYALTSGAILKTVKRKIKELDQLYNKAKENGSFNRSFEEWSRTLSKKETNIEVNMEDFMESLNEIKPSVSEKELEKYKELKNKYSLSKS